MKALVLLGLLAFAGCSHYQQAHTAWQAENHDPLLQVAELPLAVLSLPVLALTWALAPIELDKPTPSAIEMSAITLILADPRRTLAHR
jgi:hypothetical protein